MLVCVFFSGTVAHKIMQKYGFRDGQGLGKHEQGLSTALSVEKTSKRGGKIIIGDSTEKSEIIHAHTHTHTRTRTRKHTANMYKPTHHRSKINILLICCYFFSIIFVFNPMFCHLHNHVEQPIWMCVYVSASGSSQNVADPHGSNSGLTLFISCFPYQSFTYNIFFHLDHPHVPY